MPNWKERYKKEQEEDAKRVSELEKKFSTPTPASPLNPNQEGQKRTVEAEQKQPVSQKSIVNPSQATIENADKEAEKLFYRVAGGEPTKSVQKPSTSTSIKQISENKPKDEGLRYANDYVRYEEATSIMPTTERLDYEEYAKQIGLDKYIANEQKRVDEIKFQKEEIPQKIKELDQKIKIEEGNARANADRMAREQGYTPYYLDFGTDYNNYSSAKRFLKDAKDIINAPVEKDGKLYKLQAMGSGAVDVLGSADFWTLGISGIIDNVNAKFIIEKSADGKELSDSENAVMEALFTRTTANLLRASDISNWYKGGQIATESLGFMAQFIATSGVASTASKATLKGTEKLLQKGLTNYLREKAEKKFGKEATSELIEKYTKELLGNKVVSGVTDAVVGSIPRTLAMPATYANIAEKTSPTVMGKTLEDKYIIGKSESLKNVLLDSYIEVFSESTGGVLNFGMKKMVKTSANQILKGSLRDVYDAVWGKRFGVLDDVFRKGASPMSFTNFSYNMVLSAVRIFANSVKPFLRSNNA